MNTSELRAALIDQERYAPNADSLSAEIRTSLSQRRPHSRVPVLLAAAAVLSFALITALVTAQLSGAGRGNHPSAPITAATSPTTTVPTSEPDRQPAAESAAAAAAASVPASAQAAASSARAEVRIVAQGWSGRCRAMALDRPMFRDGTVDAAATQRLLTCYQDDLLGQVSSAQWVSTTTTATVPGLAGIRFGSDGPLVVLQVRGRIDGLTDAPGSVLVVVFTMDGPMPMTLPAAVDLSSLGVVHAG